MTVRTLGAHRAWLALGACLFAVFMQMLDLTIVNTALPALAHELAATESLQLLVVTGYGLCFACALLTAARLGDRFGRRTLFLAGMGVFTLASAWCAAARWPAELAVARAVQGVGAAAVAAQTIAILTTAFPPRRRALAFGVYGAVAGAAGLAGPLLGGALVTADVAGLSWRAIFVINPPLGIAALLMAHRAVGNARAERPEPVDVLGAALSAAGLGLVLFPLVTAREAGWPPGSIVMLIAGLVVLAAFWRRQRSRARIGQDALVPRELFADRPFRICAVLMLVFYGLFTALLFVVSVTAQTGLGWSAWQTGRLMLPFAVGALLTAVTSPLLVARLGGRTLTLGLGLFALGMGALALCLHPRAGGLDPDSVVLPALLAGAGMGWFSPPLPAIMVAGLGERSTGAASGVAPTVQQLGSALGTALLGTVFFTRVGADSVEPLGPQRFLAACGTVLWIIAAVAAVLTAVTAALPTSRSSTPAEVSR
ncbi:MFS transporter [Nocardia sp. NPDC004068]|uniref:MFS transporter n=1 Tax=Nocardia sp. NPDC004068 TaxID=3364303 RepID=UPI0036737061